MNIIVIYGFHGQETVWIMTASTSSSVKRWFYSTNPLMVGSEQDWITLLSDLKPSGNMVEKRAENQIGNLIKALEYLWKLFKQTLTMFISKMLHKPKELWTSKTTCLLTFGFSSIRSTIRSNTWATKNLKEKFEVLEKSYWRNSSSDSREENTSCLIAINLRFSREDLQALPH